MCTSIVAPKDYNEDDERAWRKIHPLALVDKCKELVESRLVQHL